MRAHVSMNVTDVKKSVAFYQNVFGVPPQKQTDTYAKFDLANPALNFSMLATKEGRLLSRVNHLGIEVKSSEEVSKWKQELEAKGVETLTEEETNCCFAIQDKVWFKDPDGNSWEVFFVHEQLPTEAAEPPKSQKSCSTSGCC
ncbi:MAG: VOC family protein [Bdellovibrionaceae bacterium]|nr:VOC family protein [Pseudobdellovibrionaceae bacterium]